MNFSILRSSKNLKNSVWNILEVSLMPFILFVSIPVFLNQLGAEQYGIWMFVNTVIVLMQALNLGLNSSTYKHVSQSLVEDNAKQIEQTLNTNLSLTALIGVCCFVLCAAIVLCIYQFNWFISDVENKDTVVTCLFIGIIILFTKLTEQIFYNVYRAFENFKYVTILSVAIKVFVLIGNVFIAIFTHEVVFVLAYTALVSLLGLFLNYKTLKRFIPYYQYKFKLSKPSIRYEIEYSLFIWLQSIAVIFAYQGDRLLVSYGFGLVVLSYYTIVSTLFNHVHMAFSAMTNWLFPQIVKNKENKALIFDLYLNTRNVSTVLSVFLLCLFCLLYKPLFIIWLGLENYSHISEYLKWFSIFEFFFIFTIVPNHFLNASENEKFSLRMVLFYTSLNIVGILIGAFFFNTIVAMLVGLVVSTVLAMYSYHHFIGKRFSGKADFVSLTLMFIPSLLGSGTAFFDDYLFKYLAFILCLISMYFVFIRYHRTNFKLLVQ